MDFGEIEENAIRAWLAHIEETDSDIIAEVLDKCRADPQARDYFIRRAEEVPQLNTYAGRVACGDCLHFERIGHPHLGHCTKGEPEDVAGLWDTDRRYCDRYLPKPNVTNHDPNRKPRPNPNQKESNHVDD